MVEEIGAHIEKSLAQQLENLKKIEGSTDQQKNDQVADDLKKELDRLIALLKE